MAELVDDGWGNLIPVETSGFIFSDFSGNYKDYLGNIIDPFTYNPVSDDGWGNYKNDLTPTQKLNVKTTYEASKASGDKKLEDIMSKVFKYGKSVIDILVSTGVIKNANAPISKENIDTSKYDETVKEVQKKVLSSSGVSSNVLGGGITPQNSTYFGIDFSSPIVWLIIVAVVILIFSLSKSSSPQQVYLPQPTARR